MSRIETGAVVAVVLAIIGGTLYIGRLEGRIERFDPDKIQQIINNGLSEVQKTKNDIETKQQNLTQQLNKIIDYINGQILDLGKVECGKEVQKDVPDGTTTDDWLVFGINPYIDSSEWERGWGDNAIVSFSTDINNNAGKNMWHINYVVKINYSTNDDRKTSFTCGTQDYKSPPLQVIAIRVNGKL